MAQELTEQQAEEILRNYAEGKANMHTFFTNIVRTDDTTKTGNLTEEELGMPKIPLRTYKELQTFSKTVVDQDDWAIYFKDMGEILTSTSLSKEGLLVRLAVTIKKELADVSPKKKKNKGWFKGKDETQPQEQTQV